MPRKREHDTTDEALPLDIRQLQRRVDLRESAWLCVRWTRGPSENVVGVTVDEGASATISYADGIGNNHSETLEVNWTRPNFGGERPWWICPRCCRRCAIVYAFGENQFVCRICASLTYDTSQSDGFGRAARKSLERRRRLGWELGEPFPLKPKGLHWRTWERLVAECSAAESLTHVALETWIDRLDWELAGTEPTLDTTS
jgi:hypothetical protein